MSSCASVEEVEESEGVTWGAEMRFLASRAQLVGEPLEVAGTRDLPVAGPCQTSCRGPRERLWRSLMTRLRLQRDTGMVVETCS
jgi:hypothetical protein